MPNISTIRPGLLVSLSTVVKGNVSYRKEELDPEHITEQGTQESEWKTRKTVMDPAELEAATKVRGKCASLIRSVCTQGNFLMCPDYREPELLALIDEARKLADDFNLSAKMTRIGVFVMASRVASTDAEAIRAIRFELSQLVGEMQEGVQEINVEKIRAAANKAKNIGAMLSDEQKAKLEEAIAVARTTARAIVKAGEAAALEVDEGTRKKLEEYRVQFLDVEEPAHVVEEISETAAPARAIDFDLPAPEVDETEPTITETVTVDPVAASIDLDDEDQPQALQAAPDDLSGVTRQMDLF